MIVRADAMRGIEKLFIESADSEKPCKAYTLFDISKVINYRLQ
jgi:hypothetical protein